MLYRRFFRFFRHLNWTTLRKTIVRTGQRRLVGLAAEMAYNATLALFPAIVAILTAVGLFTSSASSFHELTNQLSKVAPTDALFLIKDFIQGISQGSSQGLLSLSFFGAIWVSSGALSAAMGALDEIHQIPPKQRRPFWKAKLISLVLTLGTILFLILACFLVFVSDVIVQIVAKKSGILQSELFSLWRLLTWPLALGIVASACGIIYRYGPSCWTQGTPIMPGAILASVAWAIVSAGFRLYVSNFGNFNKIYGALGTVIVLMLWLDISCLVLLIGDQLNASVAEEMQERDKAKKAARE